MNITSILSLLGYLKHDPKVTTPNGPSFGLQKLLFGKNNRAYTQAIDRAGNLRGFHPEADLTQLDYFPTPAPYQPQIGDPHLCAFLADPKQPSSIIVMSWDAMAPHVLKSYPSLRSQFLRNPTAGRCLADFILKDVPRYQTADQSESRLFDAFPFEIDRLRMDDDCFFGTPRIIPSPVRDNENTPNVGGADIPQV